MQCLFFDIESSNGSAMCSFGYVLTDDKFNILEKKDILMNPEASFHIGPYSPKACANFRKIELGYSEQQFLNAPFFSEHYDKIKSLLEDKNTFVWGFADFNDANYIRYSCARYNLPCINFDFYDSQILFKAIRKLEKTPSLEKVLDQLGIVKGNLTLHRSDDDALLTMKIVKAICKELKTDIYGLSEQYNWCKGKLENFVIKKFDSCRQKTLHELIKTHEIGNKLNKFNHRLFNQILSNIKVSADAEDNPLKGHSFALPLRYTSENFHTILKLVYLGSQAGARFAYYMKYDYLVMPDNYTFKKKKHSNSKISFNDLLQIFKITKSELEAMKLPDFDITSTPRKSALNPAKVEKAWSVGRQDATKLLNPKMKCCSDLKVPV